MTKKQMLENAFKQMEHKIMLCIQILTYGKIDAFKKIDVEQLKKTVCERHDDIEFNDYEFTAYDIYSYLIAGDSILYKVELLTSLYKKNKYKDIYSKLLFNIFLFRRNKELKK